MTDAETQKPGTLVFVGGEFGSSDFHLVTFVDFFFLIFVWVWVELGVCWGGGHVVFIQVERWKHFQVGRLVLRLVFGMFVLGT